MNQSNFIKPELDSMPPEVLDLIIQRTAGLVKTKVNGIGGPEFEKQLCRLARISPRFKELSQAFMKLDLVLNNEKEAKKWIEGGNRRFRVKDLIVSGNITMGTLLEITDFPRVTSTLYWLSVNIEGVFDGDILRLPRFKQLTIISIECCATITQIGPAFPFSLRRINQTAIGSPELFRKMISTDTQIIELTSRGSNHFDPVSIALGRKFASIVQNYLSKGNELESFATFAAFLSKDRFNNLHAQELKLIVSGTTLAIAEFSSLISSSPTEDTESTLLSLKVIIVPSVYNGRLTSLGIAPIEQWLSSRNLRNLRKLQIESFPVYKQEFKINIIKKWKREGVEIEFVELGS